MPVAVGVGNPSYRVNEKMNRPYLGDNLETLREMDAERIDFICFMKGEI